MNVYTAEKFIDAYIEVSRETPWIQGKLYEYENPFGVFADERKRAACVVGMMMIGDAKTIEPADLLGGRLWGEAGERADRLVREAVRELWPEGCWIDPLELAPCRLALSDWNDAPERTVEDVQAAFVRARELAEVGDGE